MNEPSENLAISRAGLENAIELAGTQEKLADAIGVSQSLIQYWLTTSKKGIAAEKVLQIEELFGVPRHHLRRDLYPAPVVAELA
jgi:DNA-binding transcriptional regulator YdaS (Cro superfamily)